MIACLIVSAFDPTEVAIAFATSLAPIPQAMKMPNAAASPMYIHCASIEDFPRGLLLVLVREQQFEPAADPFRHIGDLTGHLYDLI